jgi:hypothetical protein
MGYTSETEDASEIDNAWEAEEDSATERTSETKVASELADTMETRDGSEVRAVWGPGAALEARDYCDVPRHSQAPFRQMIGPHYRNMHSPGDKHEKGKTPGAR